MADSDLTLRPLTATDVEEWAALLNAVAAADDNGEHYGADDLIETLEDPEISPERDTCAAVLDGKIAGVAELWARVDLDGRFRVAISACVHPEQRGRGVGRVLLGWAEERARSRHQAEHPDRQLLLRSHLPGTDERGARLLERAGFAPARWFADLELKVAEQPARGPAELAGLDVVTYTPELAEPLLRLRNATFADHWGSSDPTPESWQHRLAARAFRPELTVAALTETGEPVGFVMSGYYEADTEATGLRDVYLELVGTSAAYRRRGVASALIGEVIRLAAEQAYDTVSLGVDSASPTGADTLYRSLGFKQTRTSAAYDRLIETGA